MKRIPRPSWIFLLMPLALLLAVPAGVHALEEGEVTGRIERSNSKFVRDYDTLDYKGENKWEKWGKGLRSFGWIVVQGESGELKDYLLLVIDTRTEIVGKDGDVARFSDLEVGGIVKAEYRMGWDALHALRVKIIQASGNE